MLGLVSVEFSRLVVVSQEGDLAKQGSVVIGIDLKRKGRKDPNY